MLPISDGSSSDPLQPLKKTKSSDLDRKLPRPWLIVAIFSVQILILLMSLSLPISASRRRQHVPAPYTSTAFAAEENYDGDDIQCESGKVYVYNLPKIFNFEFLEKCDELNPWVSRCEALSNSGFGRKATGVTGIVPENLTDSWYGTDQFALEVIYHNRIMNHRCRTTEPQSATAFYIPFYAGLALGKYLWQNYSAGDRDRHCEMMLRWVQDQAYWNRSNGWDHFITMGRITWDFRRSKDEDWGSSCMHKPGMRNITRLLIERNLWDYFDVGVPYPTGFHPSTPSDLLAWQDFIRSRNRTTLFCFAGATHGYIKKDFRALLIKQCNESRSGSCRVVDCGGSKCSNGAPEILEAFLHSDFCLQPRGDSFTRRSIFDCMVAGSIPVFFWKRTAYYQYEWFLPGDAESYSVYIDRKEVMKNGSSIRGVLEKMDREEVRRMREKVIEYIPNIVYAKKPNEGISGIRDAFDVAIDGVLSRVKEQEGGFYKYF